MSRMRRTSGCSPCNGYTTGSRGNMTAIVLRAVALGNCRKKQCETSKSFWRGTASGNAWDPLLASPSLKRA